MKIVGRGMVEVLCVNGTNVVVILKDYMSLKYFHID